MLNKNWTKIFTKNNTMNVNQIQDIANTKVSVLSIHSIIQVHHVKL